MRGKVQRVQPCQPSAGITPAYAGKSDSAGGMYPQRRDHPRLCGEKRTLESAGIVIGGSPPPMRGKVQYFPFCLPWDRITPAYAGKSRMKRAVFYGR